MKVVGLTHGASVGTRRPTAGHPVASSGTSSVVRDFRAGVSSVAPLRAKHVAALWSDHNRPSRLRVGGRSIGPVLAVQAPDSPPSQEQQTSVAEQFSQWIADKELKVENIEKKIAAKANKIQDIQVRGGCMPH